MSRCRFVRSVLVAAARPARRAGPVARHRGRSVRVTAILESVTSPGRPSLGVPLAERSVVAARRGVPWWAAVLFSFVMTGVGISIDLARGSTLTQVFLIFYAVGCVLAVLVVMRRGVFAAMVQPPLILAVAVPLVVRVLGTGSTGGLRNQIITLALPLVNGFPTMAVTTAVTVLLGTVRLVSTRPARAPRARGRAMTADTDELVLTRPERSAPASSPRRDW